MRNQAAGVCLEELVALLQGHPSDEVAFTGNRASASLGAVQLSPASEIPKCGVNTVRSNNTAIGWIFNQLLSCTFQGQLREIFEFCPPRSGIRFTLHGPSRIQEFYTQIWASWFLQQRKCDGTDRCMVVGLPFSVNVRSSLKAHSCGQNSYWKMTFKQMFSRSVWLSAHRMLGKAVLLRGKRQDQQRAAWSLSSRTVLLWRCESCSFTQRT